MPNEGPADRPESQNNHHAKSFFDHHSSSAKASFDRTEDAVATLLQLSLLPSQSLDLTRAMKNEMDQVEKPVTLSLCVAFIVVFRRLLVVGAIVPLMCAASPLLVGIYLAIMDFVMAGFGFLSTILAFCFSLLGRMSIRRYAPSLKKRDEALAKSRLSLPLAGFVLGRILIKYLLYPVAKWIRIEEWLMYSPSLPYMTAFRLSACMLLLGIVVLARFVGPVSVGKDPSWTVISIFI